MAQKSCNIKYSLFPNIHVSRTMYIQIYMASTPCIFEFTWLVHPCKIEYTRALGILNCWIWMAIFNNIPWILPPAFKNEIAVPPLSPHHWHWATHQANTPAMTSSSGSGSSAVAADLLVNAAVAQLWFLPAPLLAQPLPIVVPTIGLPIPLVLGWGVHHNFQGPLPLLPLLTWREVGILGEKLWECHVRCHSRHPLTLKCPQHRRQQTPLSCWCPCPIPLGAGARAATSTKSM